MKKQKHYVRKIKRKVLSLILVTALITTGLNLEAMSQSIYASQTQKKENRKTQEKVTVVKELVDERTENSNTYLLSDGSKQAEIFTDSIRFEKDGGLVEYNPELVKIDSEDKEILDKKTSENIKDYLFVNESGDSKQYFPKKLDKDTGIVLNHGKYVVGMTPEIEEGQSYAPDKERDTVTYVSDERGISYEYISMKDGIKENIILNSKPEQYTFEYKIKTKNTYLKQRKNDRGILVCDSRTDKIVGYIAPPNITDGDGNTDYENVTYSLIRKNNETVITVSVNEMYFEKEDLKYPVTVDPTMQWMSDKLTTTGVWSVPFMADSTLSQNPLTVSNYLLNTYPYNSENRIYLDTKNLLNGNAFTGDKAPLKGMYIESATLTMSEAEKPTHYPTGRVQVKRALGEWDPSAVTWNTQPEISEDYIAETVCTGVEGEHHTLDITDWVQDIADEKFENHGLVFTCPSKGMSAILYGPEFKYILDENGRPKESLYMTIRVNYREMEAYDASVELGAEYNEETGKIEISFEDNNERKEQKKISAYKVFQRKGESDKFSCLASNDMIGKTTEIETEGIKSTADFRICVLYDDGTVIPSNIVTLEKIVDGGEKNSSEEQEEENSFVTYEQITIDTDGDGLEDGYEIWDFKTLWNTKTGVDEEGNLIYEQDSDGDGFPDGYEVFTLGTDPAVANPKYDENGKPVDSDGDGLSDLDEYKNGHDKVHSENVGTDPWLWDSDFDGIKDHDDFGETSPRKTDNSNVNGTERIVAYEAQIHIGLYDREYTETDKEVSYTYITNIYNGQVKSVYTDYGDSKKNKRVKYFYDEYGNNTAIIEENLQTPKNTICITYTYDKDGNVIYICDQSTKYEMSYKEGELEEVKVGNQPLVSYENYTTEIEETTAGESEQTEESIDKENKRQKKNFSENITIYGKNSDKEKKDYQSKVKTVTTEYQEKDGNGSEMIQQVEVYYEDTLSYVTELNSEGKILKFTDKTKEKEVTYTYTYTDNITKAVRSDGFTKEITTEEESERNSKITTRYAFRNLNGADTIYTSVSQSDITDKENIKASMKLYNKDIVSSTVSNKGKNNITKVYSDLYKKDILTYTTEEVNSTKTTMNLNLYAEDKDIDYKYDKSGNITEIRLNDKKAYAYEYDVHGRLTQELDYITKTGWTYGYSNTGNVNAKHRKKITDSGVIENEEDIRYIYGNDEWPDQLTKYDGKNITYDRIGNPLNYMGKMEFIWSRGRQLSQVTLGGETEDKTDDKVITYEYNENGLRTYKEVIDTSGETPVAVNTAEYEWDETRLIRETVTYNATGKKYDIWYLYDSGNNVIGFEYSQLSNMDNNLQKTRIYYEKNLQGDVIGLLDSRGAEIAIYAYDAWGNIVNSLCYEGNETPFALNHITYRSYYRDDETEFYYLQSRYYDAEVGRFVNSDDMKVFIDNCMNETDNLLEFNTYIYCLGNPCNNIDSSGHSVKEWVNKQVGVSNFSIISAKGTKIDYNCYGYAINIYSGYTRQQLNPGCISDIKNYKKYTSFIGAYRLAKLVKKDLEKLGRDAKILTKSNNKPSYKTDKNHYLIAIRTTNKSKYPRYYDYHFMKQSGKIWSFKGGWSGAVFELKSGLTPNDVTWDQYYLKTIWPSGYKFWKSYKKYVVANKKYYTGKIRYMSVSYK